ncbi:uncharacterized protein LOC124955569 [Vespa velutina]|uniref:uncharacterized protein LOC124955569 n=1 Tax=Vespa velutina TaxID=202808 RepID=UPI001FB3B39E|nr:uncharacterized protein LOC124955569 [Vespa velutina]
MTTRKKDEYEIEVNYLNRVCGKLLQILGIFNHSKEPTSFFVRFTKFLSISVCYALVFFLLVPSILHIILIEQNVHTKLKKIPLLSYNVLLLFKYHYLMMKRDHIERCMKLVETGMMGVVNLYHRDIILKKTKYGKRLFIAICVFLHITVLFWRLLVPLVKGRIVIAENVTIRPLPSPNYFFNFIDDQVSPFYEIIFFLQCAEGCVTIYTNIVICTLAVIFVMHACSQLEIFIDLLEAIVTCKKSTEKTIEEEDINAKLIIAVKHHIGVRNFLQMIESTMNPLYFMDIFGCSMTQCMLGYCLATDWDRQNMKKVFPYIISIASITVQIFVFCYVGQLLMLQDEKVALKTCVLEWHRIPYKKAKNIIPIIIVSNHRMKITAGSVMELSLQTFGQIQTRKRNFQVARRIGHTGRTLEIGARSQPRVLERVVRRERSMCSKENYEDDLRYAIGPNRYVLLSLGIRITYQQVDKRESFLLKSSRLLLILLNFIIILYVVIPGFLHIFLKETSTYGKIRVIQPILYSSMALAKYTVLVFSIERTNICLKYVIEDWKNAVDTYIRDTMKKKAIIGRRFFIICGSLMYGSGILFRGIIPLTRGKITINENLTIRPLPCPCYFLFFDPQLSPAYEIVYFLQCLSGMVTYSITTAVCGLAAFLILHICGQLEILVMLMERMVEKTNLPSEKVNAKIALAVEHQIKVRGFLGAVAHSLQQICLIEIMGCTLMVCLLSYNIMTEWTNHNLAIVFMYSIALSSIICNIFILCYIGEQLTLQAEKVARTSCTLDWYNLPSKELSGLVLVIAISNRPVKITAGNIVELSLQTFGNVIKTAATYCNMLRAVTS